MRVPHTLVSAWVLIVLSGCASLHHVQIGELDPLRSGEPGQNEAQRESKEELKMIRFEVIESGTGFEANEAAGALKSMGGSPGVRRAVGDVESTFEALTYGPRTGSLVFNDRFPDVIPTKIKQACPTGRVTGLMVTRESAKYPVVSGEVVRVTGYCIE